MSALTAHEQALYDLALESLPKWYRSEANPQATIGAFAKLFGKSWAQIDAWSDIIYLKKSFGIWLDAHARDQGTRRQTGEGDDALISRLSTPQDALTKSALAAIANAILAGAGVAGSAVINEGRGGAGGYWDPNYAPGVCYWGDGHRWDGHPHDIYVICPAGTDDGTVASIVEAMRLWAAGGVDVLVERTSGTSSYQVVTITPPAATAVHGGGAVAFTAQVRFTDTVTWRVNGVVGGNATVGTVAAGSYTPPAAVPSPVDVTVEAVSTLDGTVIGTARMKIT